jgi:4-hydroxybenzoate polyprenyltransferase
VHIFAKEHRACAPEALMISVLSKLQTYSKLVALSHTVFALPFAASAVALATRAEHVPLTWQRVALMLLCMVSARSAAMAFNRTVDRDVDADNPRTRTREIPAGKVSAREGAWLTVIMSAVFLGAASLLGFWPMVLSPLVLLVLLGYSLAKRFTWAAHAWLGVALALAPGGAWLAMGAKPNAGIVLLMVGVVTWLFGFDILYSLQDEAFDRERGLHSVPVRFGQKKSLVLSALSHVGTAVCFAAAGVLLGCTKYYFVGVGISAAILAYEHILVGPGRLEKINKAFFDMNAYVSVGFFACTLADVLLR